MVEWSGDKYIKELEKKLADNLQKAAIHLKSRVKENINRSQPYSRYVGERGIYYHGEEPSNPGEYPKKVTGFLQRSIAHEMSEDKKAAFVGTSLEYGLFLEVGTSKMAARPFLRQTLAEESGTIARILGSGQA